MDEPSEVHHGAMSVLRKLMDSEETHSLPGLDEDTPAYDSMHDIIKGLGINERARKSSNDETFESKSDASNAKTPTHMRVVKGKEKERNGEKGVKQKSDNESDRSLLETPPLSDTPKGSLICKALRDFVGENDNELSFKKGDILVIVDKSEEASGWWEVSARYSA